MAGFYEKLAQKLDELSDQEFMRYIQSAYDKATQRKQQNSENVNLFEGYESYLYKILPWAKN